MSCLHVISTRYASFSSVFYEGFFRGRLYQQDRKCTAICKGYIELLFFQSLGNLPFCESDVSSWAYHRSVFDVCTRAVFRGARRVS